jgi:DNA-binding MarR family transcriptional regulator
MAKYYTMKETGRLLGISQPTLRKHVSRLEIKTKRIGADFRGYYVSGTDIERLRKWLDKDVIDIDD